MSELSKRVNNVACSDTEDITLNAFKTVLERGHTEFSMYECDAKFSEDQDLILTQRPLKDAADSMAEVVVPTPGEWFSLQFSGEPLFRFEEMIDYILQHQCRLEIELSAAEGEDPYALGKNVVALLRTKTLAHFNKGLDAFLEIGIDSILERLYDHLLDNPCPVSVKRQFLISSQDPEILRGAMESVPEIPRALIVTDQSRNAADINTLMSALACRGVMIKRSTFSDELLKVEFGEHRFMMLYQMTEAGNIDHLYVVGVDHLIIKDFAKIGHIHWLPTAR